MSVLAFSSTLPLLSNRQNTQRNALRLHQSRHSPTQFRMQHTSANGTAKQVKRVAVIGAGWAGLSAAHHLSQQPGIELTLYDASPNVGGLVASVRSASGRDVEVGVHGMWRPYVNLFRLVHEDLNLQPFTDWTRSSQRSPKGKVVESPIFNDLPRLPTPLGTFVYTRFLDLPLVDRLSAIPLLKAVIEWDNSDKAWRKFDKLSAKELFMMYGCSQRVYKEAFEPMLLVGLFAPGEQCSAAGALGMLYYFILAHQADFDVVWPRGTVGKLIFQPLIEKIQSQNNSKIQTNTRLVDVIFDETNSKITHVISQDNETKEKITNEVDTVIFSVGISGLQGILRGCPTLATCEDFRNVSNLSSIDVMAVRLYFDRKIRIEFDSNACFGFDDSTGWTYFNLNAIHDEFKSSSKTVVEADFYHSNQFMPMKDADIADEVFKRLCIAEGTFKNAKVEDHVVVRVPRGVTHFRPGSYEYFMDTKTSLKNVFMSGDWIRTQHGSFSQEKAVVTGFEAANAALDYLGHGKSSHREIIPIEEDEAHIQFARGVSKVVEKLDELNPLSQFFMS